MNLPAAIANTLWAVSTVPAHWRFRHALRNPEAVQRQKLRGYLERNTRTAFGETHGFDTIRGYEEFARKVPLADYGAFEPWVERIRRGETNLLTHEPVTHLIPTSGSTAARKLIPFTAGLQREFDAAIGPWLADLAGQDPAMLSGPAYWCITPATPRAQTDDSVMPIGFADDASYLGGVKSRLVRAAMVSPNDLSRITNIEEFRYATLLCLLRERDLRLISIWHPSFLGLLLDALPGHWHKLLAELRRTHKRRARELERRDPCEPETLWPRLKLISCWGAAHAELALADLRRRFPQTLIQPKGLLATEAFVTIPFRGTHPLAVCSHFFEFIDEAGRPRLAHELREGETYEVVVTTSGGLWRYRLGDRVMAAGNVERAPSLRFLGRSGDISDHRGEKLSESFVAQVIRDITATLASPPRFAMLAPEDIANDVGYTLYLEGECPAELVADLDNLLCRNPQYAWCRNFSQLKPARVFQIERRGYETFVARESSRVRCIGDVKPTALSRDSTWSQHFEGTYRVLDSCEAPE